MQVRRNFSVDDTGIFQQLAVLGDVLEHEDATLFYKLRQVRRPRAGCKFSTERCNTCCGGSSSSRRLDLKSLPPDHQVLLLSYLPLNMGSCVVLCRSRPLTATLLTA